MIAFALRNIATIVCLTLVVVGTGCSTESAGTDAAPVVRIAVLQYGDVTDPVELVSSSALAVDLAIEQAVARGTLSPDSGLSFLETAGTDPAEVEADARALATDPAVIAAVVTPFVDAPSAERAFLEAGVPVFSFSGMGEAQGSPLWRRLVPEVTAEAAALEGLAGSDPCVAGATSAAPLVAAFDLGLDPTTVLARAAEEGCSSVTWLGDADGALGVAEASSAEPGGLPLIVSAHAFVERFPGEGYPATVGTIAVVPCVSVAVSREPDARRFIHAYQAGHGVPPGLCAAEGYGLGRWLATERSRAGVIDALELSPDLPTPAGPLDLAPEAERAPSVEQVVGVRWLPAPATA